MAASEHPAFSPQKLKTRLREAADAPVAFTFGIDKGGKEPVLLLHDKLSGKPLLQFLKSKKDTVVMGTFGMAQLDGKRLYLNADKNMKSLVKLCKLWVSTNKHPMVTKIIPVVGGVELADGDDEAETERSETKRTDPAQAAVNEKKKKFAETLKKVGKQAAGKVGPVKLQAVGGQAMAAIKAGDFETAKKIIEALSKAAAAQTNEPPSVDFAKLAANWIAARTGVERDIASLKTNAAKSYPHLANQLSVLDSTFKPFNRELGRTLKAAAASKDAEQSRKLANRAKAIALEYNKSLRIDPLVAHLKKNPFKNIDLMSRLSVPLAEVNAAIK